MLPGSALARCETKNPPVGRVFPGLPLPRERSALGVAAQPVREFRKRADAARLGAVAPVLQLPNKLVAGGARALPQRRELGAHRVHGVQRARFRQSLLEVRALSLAQRFFVAVEPALQALQNVRVVRREPAQLAELLGVGALERLG